MFHIITSITLTFKLFSSDFSVELKKADDVSPANQKEERYSKEN